MSRAETANPEIPLFLRLVTWVECLVVFASAAVLFFLPVLGRELWAWPAPPFNARFIGAIYFAALAPLMIFAISGRWAPGRVVLWMIFTFTTAIMLAMVVHWDGFEWSRPATYGFWFLYLFLPVNSAVHLFLLRGLASGDEAPTPLAGRLCLILVGLGLGLYGLGLLIAPEPLTSFWPWPVDAFHGRIYAATFLTPAVGAWLIQRRGAPSEHLTLGLTLLTLGIFSIAGVLITTATVPPDRQVDFGRLGTWAYFFMNAVLAALGAASLGLGAWMAARRARDESAAGFRRPAHVRPQAAPAAPAPSKTGQRGGARATLPMQRSASPASAAPSTVTITVDTHYRLEFSEGRQIALLGGREYFVGRADPANNWRPAADLTPFGGEQHGVSRQHARIFVSGIVPYIEDLGSANGTFVNDQRLAPNKPALLQDQDRIRFGRVAAQFRIQT